MKTEKEIREYIKKLKNCRGEPYINQQVLEGCLIELRWVLRSSPNRAG